MRRQIVHADTEEPTRTLNQVHNCDEMGARIGADRLVV